jgi:HK97 family phage prohead protease
MHFSNFTESRDFTETNYKSLSGQINVNEAKGIVECFVAAIGNKDSVGDICLPGCFTESLKRRKPRVVWGHNWNEPIGKVLEIYEVGPSDPRLPAKMKERGVGGLFAKVQFNLGAEKGREAFANVAFFGLEQEWSIGYKTLDAVFDGGQQANLLKEVELYEVSPVLHGANQLTATLSIKSENQGDGFYDEKSSSKPLRDPKGGLTAAGRAHFKRTEGANLKPGVKGPADTPEKMRRKGSFLTRFFTNPSGPMKDEKGKPTRLALSAAAWGEPVPQDRSDAAALAAKGRRLLERYENSKEKSLDSDTESKNHSIIYSPQGSGVSNPASGRMGNLARSIGMHFGGEVVIRSADENMVIFDITKDGTSETMRAGYHTPNEIDFMFGPATRVRQEVVYIPVEGSSGSRVSGFDLPSKPGGCGCGGACGGAKSECQCGGSCGGSCSMSQMKSWSDYKSENPGVHLFIKTASIEMYEAAQEIGFHHGFDVELLSDGFAIPNIDWYGSDASDAVITAMDGIEEKFEFGRQARSASRKPGRMMKPAKFDGDSDGFRTGPDGRDNIPYLPRMPETEEPIELPDEIPVPEPTRVPKPNPDRTPSRPNPIPAPSRPVPQRPGVPSGGRRGIEPRMPETEEPIELPDEIPVPEPTRVPKPNPDRTPSRPNPIPAPSRPVPQRPGVPSGEQRREEIRRQMMEALRRQRMASRGKSDSFAAYVTVSEDYDINVKTARNIDTKELDTLVFEMPAEMLFDFKSLIDPVADYYRISVVAVDSGLKIYDASKLTVDALDAMGSVIRNW